MQDFGGGKVVLWMDQIFRKAAAFPLYGFDKRSMAAFEAVSYAMVEVRSSLQKVLLLTPWAALYISS